jgi:hypothetical protein
MAVVALTAFLQEAGLGGYEYALKEAGIRTANDILEVDQPLELLDLSCLEEQCVPGRSHCSPRRRRALTTGVTAAGR